LVLVPHKVPWAGNNQTPRIVHAIGHATYVRTRVVEPHRAAAAAAAMSSAGGESPLPRRPPRRGAHVAAPPLPRRAPPRAPRAPPSADRGVPRLPTRRAKLVLVGRSAARREPTAVCAPTEASGRAPATPTGMILPPRGGAAPSSAQAWLGRAWPPGGGMPVKVKNPTADVCGSVGR